VPGQSPDSPPGSPGLGRRSLIALVVLGVLTGLGLRIWVLASPLGALDADEAVSGLMARHALDGDFSVFFWGQTYGGSQETLLAALVFALFGSGAVALKLVTLSLYALSAVLVWAVGRRTVGEPAAVVGALLFWISPAYLVYWSTKALPTYGFGLTCALVVVLLALRLRQRDSRLDAAGLGFALGLGWWATPQVALFTVPVLAWLLWLRPAVYRLGWAVVPAFLVGASPWFAWNARNGWASLDAEAVAGAGTTYLERFGDFFRYVLPTWLGLRVPFSLDWLVGAPLGIVLLGLSLAGLGVLFFRRPRGLGSLLLVAAAFPFLYAYSSYTYYVDEPRYLVTVAPVPALLLGWLAMRRRTTLIVIPIVAALAVVGLVQMRRDDLYAPLALPRDLSPLLDALEREDADRVLASYWLAYRISFESRERVIATSTGFVRYQPHDRLVRAERYPARVFLRGARREAALAPKLKARGYRRFEIGRFVVYARG
jgi:4-amino-4-deoxy-L-arabinose transferase-like glycosyltransferase